MSAKEYCYSSGFIFRRFKGKRLMGMLIYVTITRPDLSPAVSSLNYAVTKNMSIESYSTFLAI